MQRPGNQAPHNLFTTAISHRSRRSTIQPPRTQLHNSINHPPSTTNEQSVPTRRNQHGTHQACLSAVWRPLATKPSCLFFPGCRYFSGTQKCLVSEFRRWAKNTHTHTNSIRVSALDKTNGGHMSATLTHRICLGDAAPPFAPNSVTSHHLRVVFPSLVQVVGLCVLVSNHLLVQFVARSGA